MKDLLVISVCLLWVHQSTQHPHEGHEMATVVLLSAGEQMEMGRLTLHWDGQVTTVQGRVTGLEQGLHGIHVHERANISNMCLGAGGHFNPYKKNHGGPTDTDRHVGDLGNIHAGGNGVADVDIVDSVISLNGTSNIIGRSMVIHADEDDLGRGGYEDSKTTGHAGARVACGVIHPYHPHEPST